MERGRSERRWRRERQRNEANRWAWDKPLQEYVTAIQTGKGETKQGYSSRYIGSMVGDVGFDPLGISTLGDIKFLREAEIKHGRVAMLAAAGAIAQDIFKFPVRPSDLAAHEACVERLAGAPACRQSPSLTPTSLAFSIVC